MAEENKKIFSLLEKHRLQSFYSKFLDLGVKDEQDFIDGVTDEDLSTLGLSHVEKNRFNAMQMFIRRMSAPVQQAPGTMQKSLKAFSLQYTYPKCPEPRYITDMDPAQNTVEDLMLRIGHSENIGASKDVCLYTVDGMPLTDDPFFNTWSLQDRHINNGDIIYALFTPKENLATIPKAVTCLGTDLGTDTVRCHVMLKGDFEVGVDLATCTIQNLKNKLALTSGIPAHVLRCDVGTGNTLQELGITEDTTVYFSLSSFTEEPPSENHFFSDDIVPSVQQTKKGISVFLSSLYVIKCKSPVVPHTDLIGYIREVTGCNPLAQSLQQLLLRNQIVSRIQKIAIIEGLYTLYREILPQLGSTEGDRSIEDHEVFEYSLLCWAYIMSEAKKTNFHHENYAPYLLMSGESSRFCEPVTVPGVPGPMERAAVLQKIKDEEKIPHCTEEKLQATSLKRCTDIEKILLSVHPSITTYYLWISHASVTGQNFHLNTKKTLLEMKEEIKAFSMLSVTPPLLLKELGFQEPCLVYLSEDNLGVYRQKNKMTPEMITVYDCLSGKNKNVDVNNLAAQIGDQRHDQSLVSTRTPKEAILVLIDTSSSMTEKCYGSVDIQKIHAVKELFNNFANRSMAYNFPHIVGLIKFDSSVKTLQTFTETLETFKDSVQKLEASGTTKLYDALQHGLLELQNVKTSFPDCRLRILCLTDGNDVGSANRPADVAIRLIKSNVIVDSVLVGQVANNILHGISIASGGCCFNPKTCKDGLKLFETETVLSLEIRKPKKKTDPASVTEGYLNGLFAVHGYNDFPEAILPSQMNNKVTVTEDALKNKITEAKDGRFMEKDRRIMEELKSLHCQPHPYFTIFPSESDFTFWKILMEGPPDTSYESGVFELFCQFGPDYPVKPPTVRFVTHIYHCNINNVGRICHNIFDRGYNAHITMRDILNAVYGLLIIPEPEDPLDSILAEEYMTNRKKYDQEARKQTETSAGESLDEKEKKLVETVKSLPENFLCPLTKKIFVDPVMTKYGAVYERKAIEKHLKKSKYDPFAKPQTLLRRTDWKPCHNMKAMVTEYRKSQILETSL